LRRRPKWKGNLKLNYQILDTLSLLTHLTYNDNYYDSSIPTGMVKMKGDVQIYISSLWQLSSKVAFRFAIKNICNSKTEKAIGFNNKGRSLSANISENF